MIQISEIFESVSGEVGGFVQGSPTIFVRFSGCNLNCPFCDTKYANSFKEEMTVESIVDEVLSFPWNQVLITGGEPLFQREGFVELILALRKKGFKIQVETNGTYRLVDCGVDYWVVDCKGDDAMRIGKDSSEAGEAYYFNPGNINDRVWVKYLVASQEDLNAAVKMASVVLSGRGLFLPKFAISPIIPHICHLEVVSAILESKLPILLNVQIHKKIGAR
jgi:7-carboxy-7-deazaguanine synthase